MTDGYTGQDGDGRPGRRNLLLGGGLAVVLLAAVGASAGWVLAGQDGRPTAGPIATSTAQPTQPSSPAEDTPTERPTAGWTTTPPRTEAGGLTVPALVGTDFDEAREELHDRKLGWQLVFGTGTGREVARTEPVAGTPVKKGTTVRVYVAGPAPEVAVPDLVGDDCDKAADELGEKGLYPRYRTGRRGTVTAQEPAPDATAYWNDRVAISCGTAEPTPTDASPTP
ncbi:PASTA domain-containing protein [Micromonospora sp. CPCC 205711]|uniref:PASTA domain-containing protein n=1 Tax=Micromonospora sp. CPCC 205547 TaxID=3122400 RepID=UPI002FF2A90B